MVDCQKFGQYIRYVMIRTVYFDWICVLTFMGSHLVTLYLILDTSIDHVESTLARDFSKMDRKAQANFSNFPVNKFTQTAIKSFISMPNSKLSTNFQLNILIFEAKASIWTLLQSLKQKISKNFYEKIHQNNIIVICSYAHQYSVGPTNFQLNFFSVIEAKRQKSRPR